jgi:leucyl aminopeptidase (aminopeptidase T)
MRFINRKWIIMMILSLSLASCSVIAGGNTGFDLESLLVAVFDPQPGEVILILVDQPHGKLVDNQGWEQRREMAKEWQMAFQKLAKKRDLTVLPLLTYQATGAHNAPLPEFGEMDAHSVNLEDVVSGINIAVSLTEYSATAPLIKFSEKFPQFRAASMPTVSRSMESTALLADYSEVARKCAILGEKLDRAIKARLEFSTSHQLMIDLRDRKAEVDDGQLPADKTGVRVINLPSGEAFSAPYEGELDGQPSLTQGEMPMLYGDDLLVLQIQENRVIELLNEGPAAQKLAAWLEVDSARKNLAELGLGCNDKAVVTGNVLEDEKVLGVHLALGRSDHIGGTVGVENFSDPAYVVHWDIVYPRGGEIEVVRLVFDYEDGGQEEIIRDGNYTLFGMK